MEVKCVYPKWSSLAEAYRRPCPNFSQPRIIGFYGNESPDSDGVLHDTSKLRFVRRPPKGRCQIHLNTDSEEDRQHHLFDFEMRHILRFLLSHQLRIVPLLKNKEMYALDAARFICYRAVIWCVACTPYNAYCKSWRIVATLYRGSIYLCDIPTREKINKELNMSDELKLYSARGYKFRQCLLSETPKSEPDTSLPVEISQFSVILNRRLSDHQLLYAAVLDGIRCDRTPVEDPPSADKGPDRIIEYLCKYQSQFVGIHTKKRLLTMNQTDGYRRFNLNQWWCSLFLTGVETLLVGFRDDEKGIITHIKDYNVSELPNECRGYWEPRVCFNFLDAFLTHVKRCLSLKVTRLHGEAALQDVSVLPSTSIQLQWDPVAGVQVTDYEDMEKPTLPSWYLDSFLREA